MVDDGCFRRKSFFSIEVRCKIGLVEKNLSERIHTTTSTMIPINL